MPVIRLDEPRPKCVLMVLSVSVTFPESDPVGKLAGPVVSTKEGVKPSALVS